jgi:hypothetical protein
MSSFIAVPVMGIPALCGVRRQWVFSICGCCSAWCRHRNDCGLEQIRQTYRGHQGVCVRPLDVESGYLLFAYPVGFEIFLYRVMGDANSGRSVGRVLLDLNKTRTYPTYFVLVEQPAVGIKPRVVPSSTATQSMSSGIVRGRFAQQSRARMRRASSTDSSAMLSSIRSYVLSSDRGRDAKRESRRRLLPGHDSNERSRHSAQRNLQERKEEESLERIEELTRSLHPR